MQTSNEMSTPEMNTPPEIGRGRVSWFSVLKGYGFIKQDGRKPDLFVHHSAIVKWNSKSADLKRPELCSGERVEFEVVEGAGGKPAAKNVRVISN